jgi:hypothetical protein
MDEAIPEAVRRAAGTAAIAVKTVGADLRSLEEYFESDKTGEIYKSQLLTSEPGTRGLSARSVQVYQSDWAMEPLCSVCGLQLPITSTILPKSLQDSWAWLQ